MISAPSVNQIRFLSSSALEKAPSLRSLQAVLLPMPCVAAPGGRRAGARCEVVLLRRRTVSGNSLRSL